MNGNPLGSEFQVNSNTNGDQSNPSIIARKEEGFIITWKFYDNRDPLSIGPDVYGKRYDLNENESEWIVSEDRIFNWAKNIYPDLIPNHSESAKSLVTMHVSMKMGMR